MRGMHYTRFWAAAAIIAVIILGGFALSVPHTRDVGQPARPEAPATTTPVVSLSDSYRRGTHTLSGTVLAPDACVIVTSSATTTEVASTESIVLSIQMPPDSGTCLELPTPIPFTTTVDALKDAPITVTVNGETASTTAP